MKKERTSPAIAETAKIAAEKVIKETEKNAEAAVKKVAEKATEIVTKENVEKTVSAIKDTAKTVRKRATKASTTVQQKAEKLISKKVEQNLFIQYYGKEISEELIIDKFHAEWLKGHKLSDINSLKIYYKIEQDTAYCIVNDNIQIQIKVI